MRKLFTTVGVCLIAAMSASAVAQVDPEVDVIIDGQTIDGSDLYSITLSPSNGNLTITSKTQDSTGNPGFTITQVTGNTASVVINNFSASSSSVVAGSSVTLNWDTNSASSCEASGGFGGWNGSSIGTSGSRPVSTSSTGSYNFTLECFDSSGGSATRSVSVSVTAQNSSVEITSFFASPGAVTPGQSTTLSWATNNASSCEASGGFGGWDGSSIGTSGSRSVSTSTVKTHTFTLKCYDSSGGSDTDTTTVTVAAANTQCSSSLSGITHEWESFMGSPFPLTSMTRRTIQIPRTGYIAIKFNTGDLKAKGGFSTTEITGYKGSRYGSISTCPGDWDVTRFCKKGWGVSGGMPWSTTGISRYCDLQPNTTYYFNLTFTDGFNPSTSTCPVSPCKTTLSTTGTLLE